MSRTNIYVLRNLTLPRKLVTSTALLTGFALFLSGWIVSVAAINWDVSWMGLVDWGVRIDMLGGGLRWLLFGAHVTSLLLLLPLSLMLVRSMPLPRLTRRALFAVALTLAGLDLAAWLLLPVLGLARQMLGGVVLLLTPLLGYLAGAPLLAMWKSRRWAPPERPVRVVIVGGGFGGLQAARALKNAPVEITLVDRQNFHLFVPLLYQVATAVLSAGDIAQPIRHVQASGGGDDYLVRNLTGIDPANKLIAIGDNPQPGQTMMFCKRDLQSARGDLLRMIYDLKDDLKEPPKAALYHACIGRGQPMFGEQGAELKLIREHLGDIPLVGFFANGEIARNRLYGYTGVLTVFVAD